jgi:hypothetical protein
MEDRLQRIRELINTKESVDAELAALINGGESEVSKRKPGKCGNCGKEGHRASTCKEAPRTPEAPAAA